MSFTATLEQLRGVRSRYANTNVILIEDAANGPAIIDVLRRELPGVLPVKPAGSKVSRAEAVAPLIQAGNVHVPDPERARWVEAFVSEWCAVPNNAFWDQVDAAAQYLLAYGRATVRADIGGALVVGGGATGIAGVGAALGAGDSPWAVSVGGDVRAALGSPWD
jgi:predicted phage terminase large subunit-like protein